MQEQRSDTRGWQNDWDWGAQWETHKESTKHFLIGYVKWNLLKVKKNKVTKCIAKRIDQGSIILR